MPLKKRYDTAKIMLANKTSDDNHGIRCVFDKCYECPFYTKNGRIFCEILNYFDNTKYSYIEFLKKTILEYEIEESINNIIKE